MSRPGPPKKPTALKLLAGETRPSRIPADEPKPRDGTPTPMAPLSEEGQQAWDRLLEELAPMGVATPADSLALTVLADAIGQYRQISAIVNQSQPLVRGQKGNIVRSPAIVVWRDTAMLIRAFATEFGLTPAARARLATGGDEGDSDGADLLSA